MRGAIFRDVTVALTTSFRLDATPAIDAGATRRALVLIATQANASSRMQSDYMQRLFGRPSCTTNFAGLSPLEVRAQCALVRKHAAEQLDAAHASAILARFAHTPSERKAGIHGVAKHIRISGVCARAALGEGNRYAAIIMLVTRHYEPCAHRKRLTLRDIANETSVPKSTLARFANSIKHEADHLEAEALASLERFLVPRGVCFENTDQDYASMYVLRASMQE
jgi:hypothetical protein